MIRWLIPVILEAFDVILNRGEPLEISTQRYREYLHWPQSKWWTVGYHSILMEGVVSERVYCQWASHSLFRNSDRRCPLGAGKHCGASLVNASAVSDIPTDFHAFTSNTSVLTTNNDEPSFASADPLEIGLNSVVSGTFQGPAGSESKILEFMLDHAMACLFCYYHRSCSS